MYLSEHYHVYKLNSITGINFYFEFLIILQKEHHATELVIEVILLGKNLGI